MELSFIQNLILGFVSGLTEVLPVSGQAHRLVILKMLGISGEGAALRFMIHLGIAGALYFYSKNPIARMFRARRLSRVPKNRRKRPLDTEALMDFNLLKFALIPVILSFLVYSKLTFLSRNPLFLSAFLLLNGIILYIPQYLPGSNKLSGAMSRLDSLLLGLSGMLGMLPGVSSLGSIVSVAAIRGMDQSKALSFALMLNIPINAGFALFDLIAMLGGGAGSLALRTLIFSILAGAAAFIAVILGIRILQKIAAGIGYSFFAFYSWGAALLTFLMYLAVA